MDVIQGGKFTKNRAVSLVNDLKQVDRACGMLQEKLGFVLEYVEDVLVSIFTFNLLLCPCHNKCYPCLFVLTSHQLRILSKSNRLDQNFIELCYIV